MVIGDMIFTIRPDNTDPIEIRIESEILPGVSAIPPRSETFKISHIKSDIRIIKTKNIESRCINDYYLNPQNRKHAVVGHDKDRKTD